MAVLLEISEWLGWKIDPILTIHREREGSIPLVDGDDSLFWHVVRQDMRRAVWKRGFRTGKDEHFREEFDGIQEDGIDYGATVKDYRGKRRSGKSSQGSYSGSTLSDQQGHPKELNRFRMSEGDRGACRILWSGGLVYSTRLYKHGIIKSKRCTHCGAEKEDDVHALWDCPPFEGERAPLYKK